MVGIKKRGKSKVKKNRPVNLKTRVSHNDTPSTNLTGGNSAHSTADLHFHSTCSDGKLSPTEVINLAAQNGVIYMSLTDHDSMAGVDEAIEAALANDVFVIPGTEISVGANGSECVHILGYFAPGTDNTEILAQLKTHQQSRYGRGKEMLHKLAQLGIKLDWNRILEIAGEAAPGRPHIAQAMVENGHVRNFREAFDRYLKDDGPAYAEGAHFPPEDALRMIHRAGGISVLAHPWCCNNAITLVPELAKLGLCGLEVFCDASKIDMFSALAKESSLVMTGGSDFHGISASTERFPGQIPFSKRRIAAFLDMAKLKWHEAIVKAVEKCSVMVRESLKSQSIRIWEQHLHIVQNTAKSLGHDCKVSVPGKFYRDVSILVSENES